MDQKIKFRKPELLVNQEFGTKDCETCGPYTYGKTSFFLNGEMIFEETFDDHLNGGPDFKDVKHFKPLFEKLGYSFTYTKESDILDD